MTWRQRRRRRRWGWWRSGFGGGAAPGGVVRGNNSGRVDVFAVVGDGGFAVAAAFGFCGFGLDIVVGGCSSSSSGGSCHMNGK